MGPPELSVRKMEGVEAHGEIEMERVVLYPQISISGAERLRTNIY